MGEIAITIVHSNGRTSIPTYIREKLLLKDGDRVVWIEKGNEYHIEKAN